MAVLYVRRLKSSVRTYGQNTRARLYLSESSPANAGPLLMAAMPHSAVAMATAQPTERTAIGAVKRAAAAVAKRAAAAEAHRVGVLEEGAQAADDALAHPHALLALLELPLQLTDLPLELGALGRRARALREQLAPQLVGLDALGEECRLR